MNSLILPYLADLLSTTALHRFQQQLNQDILLQQFVVTGILLWERDDQLYSHIPIPGLAEEEWDSSNAFIQALQEKGEHSK